MKTAEQRMLEALRDGVISEEQIQDAVRRRMGSLDNPGICINCGADVEGCEPDARDYECAECGERDVFGAEEILICALPMPKQLLTTPVLEQKA